MKKYQDNYLRHFLHMYSANYGAKNKMLSPNDNDIKEMLNMGKQVEGEEYTDSLKKEIIEIENNKDWNYFAEMSIGGLKDADSIQKVTDAILRLSKA